MKVKNLIEQLKSFDGDLEVTISDGYHYKFYDTDNIEIVMTDNGIDIGVGGCRIEDYDDD